MEGESRTEKATPKKRHDERKKGNVFQSKDVIAAASTLILFFMLKIFFPYIYGAMTQKIIEYINLVKTLDKVTVSFVLLTFKDIFLSLFLVAGPIMLTAVVVGIISSGIQTKFILSGESIKFKMSNMNPLSGIKRIISLRAIIELLKSIIKLVAICFVFYSEINDIVKNSLDLIMTSPLKASEIVLTTIFKIVMKVCIVFLAIAAADYLYEWWEHERKLKMTKHEIKEEYKQTEGDPQIKSRIHDLQRSRSQQRMMQQVPTADVIVRNPTHFAIALKYDAEMNKAPIVVAKGQDFVAKKIIEQAEKYEIPMMENKPLARELYEKVPLGGEVPPECYSSIAEILAWVYSLKKEVKRH